MIYKKDNSGPKILFLLIFLIEKRVFSIRHNITFELVNCISMQGLFGD